MKLKKFLILPVIAVLMASCSKEEPGGEKGYGNIDPSFAADFKVVQTVGSSNSTTAPSVIQPEVADFKVHMVREDGSVNKLWNKVSEMKETETFPVGEYSLELYYGDLKDEGFDKPYFYGSTNFSIYDDEVSSPKVVATLCNTMVSLDYTEAFMNYFADYSTTIQSSTGKNIDFAKDEVRAAYVKPGTIKMSMTLTNKEGKTITIAPTAINNAQARTHYRVTFDVNGGEVGEAVLVITFNEELADGGMVEISLGDELFNAEPPVLNAVDFVPGQAVQYIEGDEPAKGPRFSMMAMGGFSEVILTTQSQYLLNEGWPAEVDLKNISPSQKALLLNKGLKVSGLWGTTASTMAMVDFTGVIPQLQVVGDNADHAFTIVVKDILTRATEPVTLNIHTEPLVVKLPASTTTEAGSGVATCVVEYNGANFAENVDLKCFKSNGTWAECKIRSINDLGNGTYEVLFEVPLSASPVNVRAEYKNGYRISSEMSVVPLSPNLTLTYQNVDVWATKAIMNYTADKGDINVLSTLATVYFSTDGGSTYTQTKNVSFNGGEITVTGLNPAVAYKFKVSVVNSADNASNDVSFTTEAATQIPNSNMESWSTSSIGSILGTKYYDYLPYASGETDKWWTTNNPRGYDYSVARVSVTSCCPVSYNSTVKHGGNYSVQIYTSGHGGGYASTGAILYPAGAFAGSLYIGTYKWDRDDGETVTTGHSFSTRPSSLSFWYEYIPYGTDQFKAEIEVRAGSEVIARGQYVPTATGTADSAFRQATVNLNYTNTKAKATAIYVRFLSTTKTSFSSGDFEKNKSIYIGSDSRKAHVGSILYIDDLSLNY